MFKRSCRGSIVVRHNSSVINFLWLLVCIIWELCGTWYFRLYFSCEIDRWRQNWTEWRSLLWNIYHFKFSCSVFFLAQLPHERSHRIVNKAITFCINFFLFQNVSSRANDTFVSSVLLSFFRVLLILLQLSRVSWFYFMRKNVHF